METYSPPPVYEPPPPPAPTISDFSLTLTIDCAPPPPRIVERYDPAYGAYVRYQEPALEPLHEAPRLATGVSLVRGDGSTVRLVDQALQRPEMVFDARRNLYRLTIRYELESLDDLLGKPLSEADRFVSIRVDYEPALAVHRLQFQAVSVIALHLNGVEIATGAPEDRGESGDLILPTTFQSASGRIE